MRQVGIQKNTQSLTKLTPRLSIPLKKKKKWETHFLQPQYNKMIK